MVLTIIVLLIEIAPLIVIIAFYTYKFYGEKNIQIATISPFKSQYQEEYSDSVKKGSSEELEKLFNGNVKKHIITNAAKIHSTKVTLESYRMFLSEQKIMDMILDLKEKKYNG